MEEARGKIGQQGWESIEEAERYSCLEHSGQEEHFLESLTLVQERVEN